jgi:hypothetical protein
MTNGWKAKDNNINRTNDFQTIFLFRNKLFSIKAPRIIPGMKARLAHQNSPEGKKEKIRITVKKINNCKAISLFFIYLNE